MLSSVAVFVTFYLLNSSPAGAERLLTLQSPGAPIVFVDNGGAGQTNPALASSDLLSVISTVMGVTREPPPSWPGLLGRALRPFPQHVHLITANLSYSVLTSSSSPLSTAASHLSSPLSWHEYRLLGASGADLHELQRHLAGKLQNQHWNVHNVDLSQISNIDNTDAIIDRIQQQQQLEQSSLPGRHLTLWQLPGTVSRQLLKQVENLLLPRAATSKLLLLLDTAQHYDLDNIDDGVLLRRRRRDASVSVEDASNLNLAADVDPDFPVVFNIILFSSLFLVFILVTFSMMMAYMDPGRDSVIYRVTNPNKKYN